MIRKEKEIFKKKKGLNMYGYLLSIAKSGTRPRLRVPIEDRNL